MENAHADTGVRDPARTGGWLARLRPSGNRPMAPRPSSVEVDREAGSTGGMQPVDVTPQTATGRPWLLLPFILFVVIPSFAATVYYAFVASDQYVAEARFAVRSLAEDGSEEKLGASILNMDSASQDAYIVTSFINSPDILRRLDGKVDYLAMFEDPNADFLARLPDDASREDFLAYWDDHVVAYIDRPSGIVTLTVRTFNPADSVTLASAILEETEALVNELSVRAREDLLSSYRAEVDRSVEEYKAALGELNRFQRQSGLLDPEDEARQASTLLAGLLSQAMELDSRIFVLRQSSGADAPNYRQLVIARESLSRQIDELREQITGTGDAALVNVITGYAEVETDRLMAEKLYEAAQRNYDQARAAALRKALYLTVFVEPSLPDDSLYPRRVATPLLIALGLLVLWSTASLIWASVEDHRK